MTLFYLLVFVFAGVAIMIFIGERFGKPMTDVQQSKFSKTTRYLVFILIIAGIIKALV